MGYRFRKSINLGGGFRVNISKSGVGYSWGVPGYRITKTANGKIRKTYSVPGTGISYVDESGKRNRKNSPTVSQGVETGKDLNAGRIEDYQAPEYQELLDGISNYKKWNLISNILLLTIFLTFVPFFWLTVVLGILLKFFVRTQLVIPISYSFDEESELKYEQMKNSWKRLASSKRLWQLTKSSSVKDKKNHAGAKNLVSRQPLRILETRPKFFKSDMRYISLPLKGETLILMPDNILIIQGRKIGAVSYDQVKVSGSDYRFIEEESVPSDSEVIDHTWAKVNKDGSPDKRFKGNRKLPICRYGLVTITSDSGMDIRICCSNNKLIDDFKS